MIDEIENSQLDNESRIIFDYSHIIDFLSNAHLKLSSKIYNHLFNSRYECLFSINLKHVYFTISLHSNNKHYFAFTIFNINQIQLIRMQQGF